MYVPNHVAHGHALNVDSQIPTGDREAIAAGVQSLGGQYRYHLTRDVTHLFALSPQGVSPPTSYLSLFFSFLQGTD